MSTKGTTADGAVRASAPAPAQANQTSSHSRRMLAHVLGASSCIVSTLLISGLLIVPQLRERAALHEDKLATGTAREESAGLVRTLAADRATIERLEAQLASSVQLRPAAGMNARLGELTALAEQQGVVISGIRPQAPLASSKHTTVPVSLQGEARSAQMLAFLDALHTDARDFEVRSLELSTIAPSTTPTLSLSMELLWFALPPDAPAPQARANN